MTFLQSVKDELATIRRERLASPGCKGQDYWRGYRDALRVAKDYYREEKQAKP